MWRSRTSEQGWREFLAADGVDDWVVLHGGATAVFKVASMGEAARLGAAIVGLDGFEGSGSLLPIADASGALDARRRAGNKVDITAWLDGGTKAAPDP